jgi:FkbM family methyltransferase
LGTSDIEVFKSIFLDEEYEWHLAVPPRVVVDAGAYTGFSAAWFSSRYTDAKIIAIEPSRSNFDLLRQNTAEFPNVIPRRAALWDSSGSVVVTDPGSGAWGFQVRQPDDENRNAPRELLAKEQVDALTVDDLVREYSIDRIDLLKLDIEGSELEVLANSSGWIDRVDAICLELHDRFRPGCSRAFFTAVRDLPIEVRHGDSVLVVRDEKQLIAPGPRSAESLNP